jgi:ankyrin repeat protein
MIDLFLSRGANIHVAASSTMIFTALQAAAITGNIPIVERLHKAGASVEEPPSKPRGRTAIQGAAMTGRLELLSLLLHCYKGTQVTEMCDDAIAFAQKNLHDHIMGFLLEYKEQHTHLPVVEGHEVEELDRWIDWERIS